MNYRQDIDGLRAFAVLAVILYHLGVPFVTGGFIGVDIFFVISGFLITRTIQNDIAKGRFTIAYFYLKRIRRIVPALFVVTLSTMLFALFILPLSEMKEFAKSVVSVATFTSNLFFWLHSDYFSVAAELKPMLHTWSLGIEEQFYILFPIFMLVTVGVSDKKIIRWVVFFLLLSLLLSLSPFGVEHPTANFYLPITRFWELLVGVLLSLSMRFIHNENRVVNELLAFFGVLLIILPIFLLNQHSTFPGVNALYPVLGAALVIYTGRSRHQTLVSSFLSNTSVRYIGLISYSLYLWHWPIISFAKNVTIGEFSPRMQLSIFVATFVLSAVTYRFVEQPFRRAEKFKNLLGIKTGILALMALAAMATTIYLATHVKQREIPRIDTECFKTEETLQSVRRCSFGEKDSDKIFLLFGDSHVAAMYPVFEKMALENGWRGLSASFEGCAPLFGVFRLDGIGTSSNCTGRYAKNVEYFLEKYADKIDMVYLVSRWTLYEKGWIKNGRLQKATHFLSDNQTTSENAADSAKVLKTGLKRTVSKISDELDIPVVIVESPPVLNTDIHRRFGVENVTRKAYIDQMQFVDRIFQDLGTDSRVEVVDPIKIFCPGQKCKLYDDQGDALYTDDNHVSVEGAMLYYPLLLPTLHTKEAK